MTIRKYTIQVSIPFDVEVVESGSEYDARRQAVALFAGIFKTLGRDAEADAYPETFTEIMTVEQ